MLSRFSFHLFLLSIFLQCSRVDAVVSNRTIDDTYGDSVTGLLPVYEPQDLWDDQTCSPSKCNVLPPTGLAFDQTYHAATYVVGGGARTVQLSFQGTAIYVFFILANTVTNAWTETSCSFVLDGKTMGSFQHAPSSTSAYQYNTLVYSTTGLSNTAHTLLITADGYDTLSFINFDYAIYTYDDEVASVEATSNPTSITDTEAGHIVTTVVSGRTIVTQEPSGATQTASLTLTSVTSIASDNIPNSTSGSGSGTTSGAAPSSSDSASFEPDDNNNTADGQSQDLQNGKTPIGAIVGAIVGVVALSLLAILLFLCRRRRRALAPAAGSEDGDEKSIIRRPISTSITTIFSGRVSFDGARMFSSNSKRLEALDQFSPSARTSRFDDDGNSSINLDAYSDALREKRQSMIKRQIKSLKKGLRTGSTISLWTINSGRLKDTDAARRASEQNQALKVEIERLQAQLNSDWALGLTDEPPAGYMTNPAGIDRLLPSLAEEHNVV